MQQDWSTANVCDNQWTQSGAVLRPLLCSANWQALRKCPLPPVSSPCSSSSQWILGRSEYLSPLFGCVLLFLCLSLLLCLSANTRNTHPDNITDLPHLTGANQRTLMPPTAVPQKQIYTLFLSFKCKTRLDEQLRYWKRSIWYLLKRFQGNKSFKLCLCFNWLHSINYNVFVSLTRCQYI